MQYENQPPADTAAQLIADNDGSRRNAEMRAWQEHDAYPKQHPAQAYWIDVIRRIVDHEETQTRTEDVGEIAYRAHYDEPRNNKVHFIEDDLYGNV
jgi:hypothetical protein